MTETPKCRSWLGHKFEARYSSSRPHIAYDALFWIGSYRVAEVLEASKTHVYQHDICVRCGFVVERRRAEKPAKSTN